MKVVHAADLHLDSPLLGLDRYEGCPAEELRGATRGALRNIVALCLRERAGLLLIAGDVFDGDWRDYNAGQFFQATLRPLREAGTTVVMVRGNHDAANEMTRTLRLPEHVRMLSAAAAETVEVGPVAVHGLSYQQRDTREDLVPRYPAPRPGLVNVGLLHTNVGDQPGHAPYAPTTLPALVAKGYDYWALGHVHEPVELSRQPWVVYPGNPQGRSAREIGARGVVVFEVGAQGVGSVRREIVDVARWERVEVPVEEDDRLEDALPRVRAGLRDAVAAAEGRVLACRVVLRGTSRHARAFGDGPRVAEEVRALAEGCWVEKVRVDVRPPVGSAQGLQRVLAAVIDELRANPAAVAALGGELDTARLAPMLPHVRRQEHEPIGLDVPDPASPEALRSAVERAAALLADRLGAP